jgi:hypothetical protein
MALFLVAMLKPYFIEFLQSKHSNPVAVALLGLYVVHKLRKHAQRRSLAAKYELDLEMHPQYFKNAKGLYLHWQRWNPMRAEPKGVVVLCHGFGEHVDRYAGMNMYGSGSGSGARVYKLYTFMCSRHIITHTHNRS